jgi:hypothetical protein
MRPTAALVGVLVGAMPAAAVAQVAVEVGLGALGSSILVRDSIVQELTVRPDIAPSATVAIGALLDPSWQLLAGVRWTRGDLARREGDEKTSIMTMTVWSGSLGLRRQLNDWASVQGSIGAIKYAPSDEAKVGTLFQEGAPLFAAAALAVRAERRFGARTAIGLQIAYDAHRFGTQALRSSGVTGQRIVHRISIEMTFRRSLSDARP